MVKAALMALTNNRLKIEDYDKKGQGKLARNKRFLPTKDFPAPFKPSFRHLQSELAPSRTRLPGWPKTKHRLRRRPEFQFDWPEFAF